MAEKEERAAQAAKHNALMRGAFASETAATVEAARVYDEGEGRALVLPEPAHEATEAVVTRAFAPEALYRFGKGKTVLIDPASFTRPGGAYEDGSFGPEQILSVRKATCIRCSAASRKPSTTPTAITAAASCSRIVPRICPMSRSLRGPCARRTSSPSPSRCARALENHRSEARVRQCLGSAYRGVHEHRRRERVRDAYRGRVRLWALGLERAEHVAGLFKAWIDEHPGALGRVVFAVPRASFDAFDALFGKLEEAAPAVAEAVVDEDDDEFDLSSIELPEGITLR